MDTLSSASAAGPPPGMRVRLSSNEAPMGPSARAVDAAATAAAEANLYPDDQSLELRRALADAEGCDPSQIAVGTGSAAVLFDIIGHECRDGGAVLAFERSYLMYRLGARRAGASYLEVADSGPATRDRAGYARDVDALLDRVTDDVRVVVVDNPGNPTNSFLTGDEVQRLVVGTPEHVTVVVDEAYHQFGASHPDYRTVDELELEHPRLLVTRTFSKAYAMAGMRLGYLRGPAGLIADLDAWRVRFNVPGPTQAAAVAALADTGHLQAVVDATVVGRRRMADGLRVLGVPITEGLGNFITIELGEASARIVERYAEHGVGVRALLPYGMDEQIRVTVGTEQQVEDFLDASSRVLPGVVAARP